MNLYSQSTSIDSRTGINWQNTSRLFVEYWQNIDRNLAEYCQIIGRIIDRRNWKIGSRYYNVLSRRRIAQVYYALDKSTCLKMCDFVILEFQVPCIDFCILEVILDLVKLGLQEGDDYNQGIIRYNRPWIPFLSIYNSCMEGLLGSMVFLFRHPEYIDTTMIFMIFIQKYIDILKHLAQISVNT